MGDVTRIPVRVRLVSDVPSPAARVIASHRLVEQAVKECHDGLPGSGPKALCFAAATHLALTIGPDSAGDFFEMVARVAREVRNDAEPA